MKILHIAEKPSVARTLTQTLSRSHTRAQTLFKYTPAYTFTNNTGTHVFTSVLGHLYTTDFATDITKNWLQTDPITLFSAEIKRFIASAHVQLAKNLKMHARDADRILIWTDCDREGEYIASEIQSLLGRACVRARFAAITAESVQEALSNPSQIDERAVACVAARMELDLRIGAALTRLQTLSIANNDQSKNKKNVISYGSCQIPTLGFVVERDLLIKKFVSEKFFGMIVNVRNSIFNWKRSGVFDKNFVVHMYNYLFDENIVDQSDEDVEEIRSFDMKKEILFKEEKSASDCNSKNKEFITTGTITEIKKTVQTRYRPFPLRTVDMQRILSKFMPAHRIMSIAESLYQKGIISYPRTETDAFPEKFDHERIKKNLMHKYDFKKSKFFGPRRGKNNDHAHLPIYPLRSVSDLNGDDKRVYDFICDRYIACISEDAILEQTVVVLKIKSEEFTLEGYEIKKKGYLWYYMENSIKNKEIGIFRENEKIDIHGIGLDENESNKNTKNIKKKKPMNSEYDSKNTLKITISHTSPPKHLTESDLIAKMDKNQIGTDSTIHEHIKKILDRNYIKKVNIFLIPTNLGKNLVNTYKNLNLNLHKPQLRANFENELKRIEKGLIDSNIVIKNELEKYLNIYKILENNRNVIKKTFQEQDKSDSDDGNNDGSGKYHKKSYIPKNEHSKESYKKEYGKYNKNTKTQTKNHNGGFKGIDFFENKENIQTCSTNAFNTYNKRENDLFSIQNTVNTKNKKIRIESNENMNIDLKNDLFSENQYTQHNNKVNRNKTYKKEETVFCDCKEVSQILKCKKGKNEGKEYHCCPKFPKGCNYFKWKGLKLLKNAFGPKSIKCQCNDNVRAMVSTSDKNWNRVYFKCNRRYKPCNFFKWEDEVEKS